MRRAGNPLERTVKAQHAIFTREEKEPCLTSAFPVICRVYCPDQTCCHPAKNTCNGKNFFDAGASSSYAKMGGKWATKWPIGAEGFVGNDTVRLGAIGSKQLVIPTTAFGQATKFISSFTNAEIDGMLGLGLPLGAAGGITPPVYRAMDLGLLDKSLFTVYMKAANGQRDVNGGSITYGAIDTVHCGPIIAYEPLTTKTHWEFEVKAVKPFNVQVEALKSGKYVLAATWKARSDTSNPFIEIPAPEAAAIADAHGAKWDDDYGHYVVDCSVKATLELTIGQHKYTIGSENFVVSTPDGRCVLALKPLLTMSFGLVVTLGVPFHRQYCTIHDVGQLRIGFADSWHD
ncbi:eukaryotic aspartyl protease [Teladorsagia circumcincta]|uniref:Eukaryotic aspartyl protease n=1 Tax=Teladorsagia circumcincta TaxID=45464 RepID=A0A2G9UT20_TELCI|nr:eukaryotic aspartyl protease [Teladorsagia circumcincta]